MCVQAASAGMKRYFSLSAFPVMEKKLLTLSAITSAEYSKEFKVPVCGLFNDSGLFFIPPEMSRLRMDGVLSGFLRQQ